jgi:hypothetical protein
MVRNTDLDTLRAHLTEQWVTLRDEEKKRTDLVDDVCRWVSGLIEEFSGFPDPATGASMPWWQARQMQAQSKEKLAKEAYAKAPEGYRARAEGRPVPSFHRARVTPEGKMVSETKHTTPVRMREPGEDVEYDEEESGVLS